MARPFDGRDFIVIVVVAIFVFGGKFGGKSWQEMADAVARGIQQIRQGDSQAQIGPATVRQLTLLAIVCVALVLELLWLATRL